MRLPRRNNASATEFPDCAAELTKSARLSDLIPIRVFPYRDVAMAEAVPARLDAHFGVDPPAVDRARTLPAAGVGDIRIAVYEDLAAIEQDWRALRAAGRWHGFPMFRLAGDMAAHIGVRKA